jgi:DNA-binding XRE family transcriptional regulator
MTSVSDAAANTVGSGPPDADVELVGTAPPTAVEVVFELLDPQPPATAESPMTASAVSRRAQDTVIRHSLLRMTEYGHSTTIMAVKPGSPIRERRLECGLTQADLASRAGVSRQLVAAVEAGRNVPAVDAALGLARALATTVEDLFAEPRDTGIAAMGEQHGDGPVRVGRVAEQLVTAELPDHGVAGTGWAKADGVVEAGRLRLFAGAVPAGLVLAGCDPALGVAERMLDGLGVRSLLAISAPTGVALPALGRGSVHAAVVHGVESELPNPPVEVVRWHLAGWQVGVAVTPRLRAKSLEAVLHSDLPIVQRDPAAVSQQAFERARRTTGVELRPGGPDAAGHLDAARIAATLDGAGVTTEGAARAFGLDFLALEDHIVEVWIAQRWRDHPGVIALGELLATKAFTERVSHFGGYDLTRCGQLVS